MPPARKVRFDQKPLIFTTKDTKSTKRTSRPWVLELQLGKDQKNVFEIRGSYFTTFGVVHLQKGGQISPALLTTSSGVFMNTRVSGGTDSVIHTLPPTTDRAPITVSPPRIVAPA